MAIAGPPAVEVVAVGNYSATHRLKASWLEDVVNRPENPTSLRGGPNQVIAWNWSRVRSVRRSFEAHGHLQGLTCYNQPPFYRNTIPDCNFRFHARTRQRAGAALRAGSAFWQRNDQQANSQCKREPLTT